MGFFTQYTEVDALNKIEAINMEMREICALIHANGNLINSKNSSFIRQHCENIVFHINDYENIKSKLSEYDKTMLMGKTINVWNGEQVGIFMWEYYLSNVMRQLQHDINIF